MTVPKPRVSLSRPASGFAASAAKAYSVKYRDTPAMPRESPTVSSSETLMPWGTPESAAMTEKGTAGTYRKSFRRIPSCGSSAAFSRASSRAALWCVRTSFGSLNRTASTSPATNSHSERKKQAW